jgi:hypothetical protein
MQLKLSNVRLAFPQLFEAKSVNGSEPAFSASFIVPKGHPQFAEIEKAVEQVANEKWGAKSKAVLTQLKSGGKVPLRSGDDKASYNGFEGNFYISARTKSRPAVVDRDRGVLTQSDGKPYAGCYVNVSLDLWAQDNQFGKRVNASLRGVQFVKDGEAFSGSSPASADEFDIVEDLE